MPYILTLLVSLSRLVPLPYGVAPVGGFALYAGSSLSLPRAIGLTMVPVLAGFVFVGAFNPIVMAAVALGFALSTLAGRWFLAKRRTLVRGGAAVVTGALTFYFISNAGVWLAGYYPFTAAGLADSLIMGLPFLRIAIVADAFYLMLMFGIDLLGRRYAPHLFPALAR
ncbi:MAG: DUF6580 family putative transport protein [Pseudomonadota bacterium]